MGVLSRIFPGFFNKFEDRHNEILEAFEAGKLSSLEAAVEIQSNARDSLSKNDPRSMMIFRAIFHVCSAGVQDESMTAVDAAAYMIHGTKDILHTKDPRRMNAFREIMDFIYKNFEDGKMDLKNSSYGLSLASETLLPEPFARDYVEMFRMADSDVDFLGAVISAGHRVDIILHGAPVSAYPQAAPTRF